MAETSPSLLERLRAQPNDESWRRLVDIYTPFIRGWVLRCGIKNQDADDLCQEVLTVVMREMPQFHYDRMRGTFRGWLRQVTTNCLRKFRRTKKPVAKGDSDFLDVLHQLESNESGISHEWDAEHDRVVLQRLLQLIKDEFKPQTWQAFHRLTVDGLEPRKVAEELGVSVGAVYIAKSRVMRRLQQEAVGLVDE